MYLLNIIRFFPNFFWPLKRIIIKNSLKSIGTNVKIPSDSIIFDPKLVEIGNNFFAGQGLYISTNKGVIIYDNVMMGPQVMLIGGNHNFSTIGKLMFEVHNGGENEKIIIKNDVWIGARTIILKGVTIGEGAVIGAGSVVTKSILPYSINGGNPCKFIRCRFNKNNLEKHLFLIKSSLTIEQIIDFYNKRNIEIE